MKRYLASFVCLLLIIFSTSLKAQPYDEAVSLGYGCQVAHQLETFGLRKLAYPFDWFHTSYEGLISFIANKGKDFLTLKQINVVGIYPGDPRCLEVHDLLYGIISYHDFASNPVLMNYAAVKAKYDRRVKRFFDLLNTNKRVLFVIQYCTRVQIEQLNAFLHSLYPRLTYTLVAVGNTEEYLSDWGLPGIDNYYMEDILWDWRGNSIRWHEILTQYSVTPNHMARPVEERW